MTLHRPRQAAPIDRLLDGLALIALHEADALNAHLNAAGERLRLAWRARSARELLRDQVDLLPESRNRLRRDHAVRRQLWQGLARDLRSGARRLRRAR
ncbi:MAG: hypothetical protein ACPHN2_09020 [Sinimarinibacterium flocculans]|uniref:hypothetical protein n=1 Tax=Sinimarinibacterium flocculans TaxID=985250 RepID=UPI003C653B45